MNVRRSLQITPVHTPALTSAFEKSERAFRTISEVANDLDVGLHVLRFWESKFDQVRPIQRGGGRRYYRPEDVDLLRRIRELLYEDGYTIKGAQRLLKESRHLVKGEKSEIPRLLATVAQATRKRPPAKLAGSKRRELETMFEDLQSALDLLRRTLHVQ